MSKAAADLAVQTMRRGRKTAITLALIFVVLITITLRLRLRGAPVQSVEEEFGEESGGGIRLDASSSSTR